ncbi:MAG: CSLREA domain-containing protein [Actinomycetota bacterium]|nr:CSLREA domain-containing protein [Actinomycetota bacterium]
MKRLLLLFLLSTAALVAVPAANAVTIGVNTTDDTYGGSPGSCSLREAITAVQTNAAFDGCPAGSGADRISLPAGEYRITRAGAGENFNSTGDFDIDSPDALTIESANSDAKVSISGNGIDRVFDKSGLGSLSLSFLQVKDGDTPPVEDGGGIRHGNGSLSLESVTVAGNKATIDGGGVVNYATMSAVNSTISGNEANGSGGGLYAPGGSVTNLGSSTIAGNSADADANGNGDGGGFRESGNTTFRNVINAGNEDRSPNAGDKSPDCYSGALFFPRFVVQTQQLQAGTCLTAFNPPENKSGVDALVGPLADNGGQTPTHALLEGSPAIGAGGTGNLDVCPPVDQTGRSRPAGSCDIGAVQYVAPTPPPPLGIVVKIGKVKPKVLKLKRGKKTKKVSIAVSTAGGPAALNTKLCLKPTKAIRKALRVKGKLCRKLGTLAGAKTVRFRIAARKKARKKTFRLKAVLSATDAASKTRKIKVKVK